MNRIKKGVRSLLVLLVATLLLTSSIQAQEPTPAPKHSLFDVTPYVALVGGAAADLGTTYVGFQHGAVEGNRLTGFGGTQNIKPLIVTKALGTVAVSSIVWYLAGHGHPKLAKALGYTVGGMWGTAAVLNVRTTQRINRAQ
jgi:hypothetical protein